MATIAYWSNDAPYSVAGAMGREIYKYTAPSPLGIIQVSLSTILTSDFRVAGVMSRGQDRNFFTQISQIAKLPFMQFIPVLRASNSVLLPDYVEVATHTGREQFELTSEAILFFIDWAYAEGVISSKQRVPVRVEFRDVIQQPEGVGTISKMTSPRKLDPLGTIYIQRARLFTATLTGDLPPATVTRTGR